MRQNQIRSLLFEYFGIHPDKGTISRNMRILESEGFITFNNGYFCRNLYDDTERRILCDSLLFTKQVPCENARTLIYKILPPDSPMRNSYLLNVEYLVDMDRNENGALYEVLNKIDEAIRKKKRVMISPCAYNIDKELVTGEDYTFDPYYIVSDKCRYFLLGGCEKHGTRIESRRIDRIEDIRIMRTRQEPVEYYWHDMIPFDIKTYLKEHIYMFAGESSRIRMEIRQNRIGDFIDWFGKDFSVCRKAKEPGGNAVITVRANVEAVYYWALQYCGLATILTPKKLSERLYQTFIDCAERYRKVCGR